MSSSLNVYSKERPFLARVKERYSLCKPGSKKDTQHLVLDLGKADISYNVGDSIGVLPLNDPEVVEFTLNALGAKGSEVIFDKRSQQPFVLREFLSKKASITELNKKLLVEFSTRQSVPAKKAHLDDLLHPDNKQTLKDYMETHEIWRLLDSHPEALCSPQELCDLSMPLLPRFYSISSSSKEVGSEVHLTVAFLEYDVLERKKRGVCTHYLCNLVKPEQDEVPIFIQPSHAFGLPSDPSIPIIMVGPGTGIAPYRAFMQERLATKATGKNWLFFGEWNRSHHFLYEEYWLNLEAQGHLRLDVAFSRDQEHKVYVQHKMLDYQEEIFDWLEKGAYFYVCGDANRMAKDVEATLHQIFQNAGKMSEKEARDYIKKLRIQKRYLRDVY